MEYRLDGHDGDYYSCCSDYGSIYIHLSSNIKYPMPTMKLQCEFYYCIKEDVIHDSLVSAALSLGMLSINFKLQISLSDYCVSTTYVAKGFTQTHVVDYDETFSPIAMAKSIRILLATAAYYDYEIW